MIHTPNVLVVVWDACRLDAASGYAPNLAALAEDNLWFENAITPAGYSLPSHTSLLTGEYPHEHGVYSQEHQIERAPLLERLGDAGYDRYGVSANGFASGMYGFDREFDEFYNTQAQTCHPEGLDVHAYASRARDERGDVGLDRLGPLSLLRAVLTHERPLLSACNVLSAALTEVVRSFPALRRVPHRRFSVHAEFAYRPETNTRTVRRLLRQAAGSDSPFFLFANYMDAHHPYAPPRRYQRAFCGRTFTGAELRELADLTHPLEYRRRVLDGDTLEESTRATLRNLYLGEVRTVDEHLGRLLATLEETGLREDTLVVVTADHGENLGERDDLGERSFGHVLSASDNLLRVPLVVAHPSLEGRRVEEYVSIKDLFGLCTDPGPLLASGGADLGPLRPDGPVAAEVPAYVNDALESSYPELTDLLSRHVSVTYGDDWKLVDTSAETRGAFHRGERRDFEAAPAALREACERHLEALRELAPGGRQLGAEERRHLEALGYL